MVWLLNIILMYVCYLLQLIARKLICFKDHLQLRKIVLNTSTLHLLQESKTLMLHQTIFEVYHDSYKEFQDGDYSNNEDNVSDTDETDNDVIYLSDDDDTADTD